MPELPEVETSRRGIAPWMAVLMSVVVFAGASMVASAQLLASDTPALMVVLATLFINLRFMMYSASLRLHFAHASLGMRALVAYLIADNVYGVLLSRVAEHRDPRYKLAFYLGTGAVVWAAWQAAVLAGALLGAGLPASWRLEFAAPLAFIALTVPLLRDRAMVAAALAAAVTVVAAWALPMRLALAAAALVGIAVGLAVRRKS